MVLLPINRDRRPPGRRLPWVFPLLALTIGAWVANARAADVVLSDARLTATFDSDTGALIRLESKPTHWVIERRPELGISFRLHAPLPNRRDNFVLGQKQHAAGVTRVSGHEVRIRWSDLKSEHGGVLPMTFTATVTLQDGALRFAGTLENNSDLTVETVDYPYFGDLNAPGRDVPLAARTMWYGNLQSDPVYPDFTNEKGYWGVFYPTKTFESNRSLFCLIQAPTEGLYVEMENATQPYLLQYTFEQHPGVENSIDSAVPRQDALSGLPVHLEFRTCHFLFAHPHTTTTLVPVVVQPYRGDWHAGVDLYKHWRATWFQPPRVPAWTRDVNSWLQLQINAPEEDWRVPYNQLVKYGQECADNGVRAIQLVGWNRGGQDRGDPAQDPDPRLGTWQQLHDAIAAIQAKGVKIVLFGKLNWADLTTDWYKRELYRYEARDPYGLRYEQGGYSYYTPTQLAGINNRRRAVMDFLDPAYRDVATHEFEKLLKLGAAGWLFDENCHHGPVKYNFAPGHGYTPPGFIYGGDLPLARQLRAAADKVDPDFVFAGEGHMDWLKQVYPLSYFRITAASTAVDRYIDPQEPLMVAVTGIDDREMLNLTLLDRYIISYEPYNFKGHVTDFPLTLAYGKKIDALRRRYRAWLWDADFRDTLGATVTADGAHRYSVFVGRDGRRAVVVVNQEKNRPITAKVALPNAGRLASVTPEAPDTRRCDGTLEIPPRSAAVVLETGPIGGPPLQR
ncbi:MAG TPA: DUF6259 domain-containing protein [Opitutaceae bacterium]|nr:DUF6259 domain-containing protein [Opitutaceae bacterium]